MARISKLPEERKHDLIDAAERLFVTKGYDQTAISDIVKEVKVAQGTFYYHFKSKADILEAVVNKSVLKMAEKVRLITEKDDIDPVAKLNGFFDALVDFGRLNDELTSLVHRENNLILHQKMASTTLSVLVPLLSKIIRDGAVRGVFDVAHPVETAALIIVAVGGLFHDPNVLSDADHIQRAKITVEQTITRVLGMKEGAFRMHF
jgi:AcrR family transcriptional regulator